MIVQDPTDPNQEKVDNSATSILTETQKAAARNTGATESELYRTIRASRETYDPSKYTDEENAEIERKLTDNYILQDALSNTDPNEVLHSMVLGDDDFDTGLVEGREALDIDVDGMEAFITKGSGYSATEKIRYSRVIGTIRNIQNQGYSIIKTEKGKYWVESNEDGKKVYAVNSIVEIKELLDSFLEYDPTTPPPPPAVSSSGFNNPQIGGSNNTTGPVDDGTNFKPEEEKTTEEKVAELAVLENAITEDEVIPTADTDTLLDVQDYLTDSDYDPGFTSADYFYGGSFILDGVSTLGALGIKVTTTVGTGGLGYLAGAGFGLAGGLGATALSLTGDIINPDVSVKETIINAAMGVGFEWIEAGTSFGAAGMIMRLKKAAPLIQKALKYGIKAMSAGLRGAATITAVSEMGELLYDLDELIAKDDLSMEDWRKIGNVIRMTASILVGAWTRKKAVTHMSEVNKQKVATKKNLDTAEADVKKENFFADQINQNTKSEKVKAAQVFRDNAPENAVFTKKKTAEAKYQKVVDKGDAGDIAKAKEVRDLEIADLDAQVSKTKAVITTAEKKRADELTKANDAFDTGKKEATKVKPTNDEEFEIQETKLKKLEAEKKVAIKKANKDLHETRKNTLTKDEGASEQHRKRVSDVEAERKQKLDETISKEDKEKLTKAKEEVEKVKLLEKESIESSEELFGVSSTRNIRSQAVAKEKGRAAGKKYNQKLRDEEKALRLAERARIKDRKKLSNHHDNIIKEKEKELALLKRNTSSEANDKKIVKVEQEIVDEGLLKDKLLVREAEKWNKTQMGRDAAFEVYAGSAKAAGAAVRGTDILRRRFINPVLGYTAAGKRATVSIMRQSSYTGKRYDTMDRGMLVEKAVRAGFSREDVRELSLEDLQVVMYNLENTPEKKKRGGVLLIPRAGGGLKTSNIAGAITAIVSAEDAATTRNVYVNIDKSKYTAEELAELDKAFNAKLAKLDVASYVPDKWPDVLSNVYKNIKISDIFSTDNRIHVTKPNQEDMSAPVLRAAGTKTLPNLARMLGETRKSMRLDSSSGQDHQAFLTKQYNNQFRKRQEIMDKSTAFTLGQEREQNKITNQNIASQAAVSNQNIQRRNKNDSIYAQQLNKEIARKETLDNKDKMQRFDRAGEALVSTATLKSDTRNNRILSELFGKKRIYNEQYAERINTAMREGRTEDANVIRGKFIDATGINPQNIDEMIFNITGEPNAYSPNGYGYGTGGYGTGGYGYGNYNGNMYPNGYKTGPNTQTSQSSSTTTTTKTGE